jgi:hypothetical protein
MGRIPKLVKERALKELKEQQEAAVAGANEVTGGESSYSFVSDQSVENDDPNAMETGIKKNFIL